MAGNRDLAVGRLKSGSMNKTEAAYAEKLREMSASGEILWWRFEAVKLRLADNTFYTPDFLIMNGRRELECHEVKGFWRDDAKVKLKVAADIYPMRFVVVQARAKKHGGGFVVTEV